MLQGCIAFTVSDEEGAVAVTAVVVVAVVVVVVVVVLFLVDKGA